MAATCHDGAVGAAGNTFHALGAVFHRLSLDRDAGCEHHHADQHDAKVEQVPAAQTPLHTLARADRAHAERCLCVNRVQCPYSMHRDGCFRAHVMICVLPAVSSMSSAPLSSFLLESSASMVIHGVSGCTAEPSSMESGAQHLCSELVVIGAVNS